MPPLPQNVNAVLGAGVLGILCAASLYIVEHYRQERRKMAMAKDLARLNTEVTVMRQELDKLLSQQKQSPRHRHIKRRGPLSVVSASSATEDYVSAVELDSSDLEFYDVSDEENGPPLFEKTLKDLDLALEKGTWAILERTLERLQNLCLEHPESPQLLWRIGKAHFHFFEKADTEQLKKEHIEKGVAACSSALKLKPPLAEVHKWYAILIGQRTQYQPIKEKLQDGYLIRDHVKEAMKLDQNDATLPHMLGRFSYEVAELKWYERKIAAALFGEVPTATYEDALEYFLNAEELSVLPWKENKLLIAKCRFKLGEIDDGLTCLQEADRMQDSRADDNVLEEIRKLLEVHGFDR